MTARNTAYWICQVLGWGAYSGSQLWMAAAQTSWSPGLAARFGLFFLYSIALTHVLRDVVRRRQWLDLPPTQAFPRLIGAALLVGAIQTLLVVAVDFVLGAGQSGFGQISFVVWLWVVLTTIAIFWTMLYAAVSGIRRSREARRVSLETQLALREAELRALESQLDPHFLFNCLNSIRAMIGENPAEAQDMVTRLANILRYNLQRDPQHTAPLAREVEIVSDYLALESARFEERLRVRVEIEPNAAELPVPTMLLQTLVENGLKHGIRPLPAGGELLIRARLQQGLLRIDVENSGSLRDAQSDGAGIGLRNARDRLRLLYGGRAELRLTGAANGRVQATVEIPTVS
jgi:hypothetical protein